jgi:hypothetical protein
MHAHTQSSAMAQTKRYHTEQQMRRALAANPTDSAAVQYFATQKNDAAVQQQFQQVMQEYPESLARVLMLYVSAKINGHEIQAFCDSGAQSTIMSKRTAIATELLHLVDERFAGTAVGVGTGKILGRVHLVQLELTSSGGSSSSSSIAREPTKYYFPCTVTVMVRLGLVVCFVVCPIRHLCLPLFVRGTVSQFVKSHSFGSDKCCVS